ncbi:MAG: hypothetical protein ACXWAC_10255 [Usitatibacter sp.]
MRLESRIARRRFVHLGDRLLAIGRIHSGALTVEEAAAELGVAPDEVIAWQRQHAFERLVSVEEIRSPRSAQMERLARRAERLAGLVADTERELRELHQELLRGAVASNEPFGTEGADAKKVE